MRLRVNTFAQISCDPGSKVGFARRKGVKEHKNMLIKSRCDTFSIADFLSIPVSFLVLTMAPRRE